MKKGIFGIILVLCVFSALLTGCGGPTKPILTFEGQPNLLVNHDFETGGLDPWQADGCTVSVINSTAHGGSWSCLSSGRSASWQAVMQEITELLNANGKGTYQVECYAKLATGSDDAKICWDYTDDSQTNAYNKEQTPITINSDGWTLVSAIIDMNWSGTLKAADITVHTTGSTANLYIDDFTMVKGVEK
jgi:Carbohydrate binding domain.